MALSENIKREIFALNSKYPFLSLLEFQTNDGDDKVVRFVRNHKTLSFVSEKYWLTDVLRHWKMNDNSIDSSGIVLDSSPNLGHAYAVQQTSELHVDGKIDGALDFNGEGDYVDAGADSDMNVSTFSVSIWVMADEKETIRTLIGRHEITDDWWQLIQRAEGIRFELHNGSSQFNTAYTDDYEIQSSDADEWLHFVITMDAVSGIAKLYYNAVLIGTVTGITNFDMSHTADLLIGSAGINFESGAEESNWKGPIDNVVYFEKVLTLDEVKLLYWDGVGTELIPATYTGFNFDMGIVRQSTDGKLSQISLSIAGMTDILQADIEVLDGATGSTVVFTTINEHELYEDFEDTQEIWDVLSPQIKPGSIEFVIGAPSPLLAPYPLLTYSAKRCPYRTFKGFRCKYSGEETTCDRLRITCKETMNNVANFGGDPELGQSSVNFV